MLYEVITHVHRRPGVDRARGREGVRRGDGQDPRRLRDLLFPRPGGRQGVMAGGVRAAFPDRVGGPLPRRSAVRGDQSRELDVENRTCVA